ncbi:hypothetical protein [uncultured Sulfitobacter sp.]|uniref:hypothetical protein n=1 Tax=uncultured Sulfitobacter sp. TaxID=191468 RepID=UPI002638AC59|nr:hypothetical protein [uncultured Sulfitobacter sp.]
MKINLISLMLILSLAACGDGTPFSEEDTGNSGDGTSGDGDASGDGTDVGGSDGEEGIVGTAVPPGTVSPSRSDKIVRYEERGESEDNSNGFVRSVRYEGETDTFLVDNLAFDSANVYQRGTDVSSLAGQYQVYESTTPFPDSVTNDPIDQFGYRAIYGVSRNLGSDGEPETQFAIVRSGSFRNYGFGGFLYQRNGSVELPQTGQATFTGQTAGIRDFDGAGGVQYTSGQLKIDIDFEDFNDVSGTRGDGVKGVWSDRRVFDAQGNDITRDIIDTINPSLNAIPTAIFTIRPGNLKDSGDLVGELDSPYLDADGEAQVYEEGNFYAVVSGDEPSEIAGVLVVTNDVDFENVTTRETAGFIVYRGADN